MPEGIIATDHGDGFVTLDFVDKALRGPALAELVEIGGAASIETISRVGPRRQYRVPLGNATEAGLVDDENTVEGVRSAGQDTGRAAALKAADPNVNPGADNADWHTPVAEHTSANAYVGQVPNSQVLDRAQVFTGDAGSYGGSGKATTHRDLIEHVKANSSVLAVGGVQPATEGFAPMAMRASEISGALADQTAALGSDPGAWGEPGGEALAEDYTSVQATREGESAQGEDQTGDAVITNDPGVSDSPTPPTIVEGGDPTTGDPGTQGGDEPTTLEPTPAPATQPYPEGTPTEDWKRAELDAYALAVKGIDTTQEPNKAAVVAAIQNAPTPT
ncbi:hypothetical protein I5G63_gp011 [Mycobacterium phage Imvubu]|uniref:Uncharacterized protein n=1 Tax=Mycobacterium phage Imvubu TaxID=2686233 RepID=A0A6B9L7J5_9CAUD|nr:hypothetical protein I5G63_gp011 [Mycobacterium phage Imvubu]QHB37752.1 hypothetical protein PBI_IMVUBU_11 [Mycobacterium phage Imvubu]